ncbi:MAG: nucleotide exchange factor GrpE [Planctomycetota bacterium]
MMNNPVSPDGRPPKPDGNQAQGAEPQSPDAVAQIAELQRELDSAKDRALRFQAELDNYRKRADREIAEERRYANLPLMRDLLPVLDNMHRAVEAAQKTPGGEGLIEGFQLVAEQFESALRKHHCVPIAALKEPFDPHFHQAIAQQPSGDPPGTITLVTQTGFKLHDRVVRPSQVIISSGTASEKAEPADKGSSRGN